MRRLCRVSSPEPTSTDPKICPGNQTDFAYVENIIKTGQFLKSHCSDLMKWLVRSFETDVSSKESTSKSSFSFSSHMTLLLSEGS